MFILNAKHEAVIGRRRVVVNDVDDLSVVHILLTESPSDHLSSLHVFQASMPQSVDDDVSDIVSSAAGLRMRCHQLVPANSETVFSGPDRLEPIRSAVPYQLRRVLTHKRTQTYDRSTWTTTVVRGKTEQVSVVADEPPEALRYVRRAVNKGGRSV